MNKEIVQLFTNPVGLPIQQASASEGEVEPLYADIGLRIPKGQGLYCNGCGALLTSEDLFYSECVECGKEFPSLKNLNSEITQANAIQRITETMQEMRTEVLENESNY